MSCRSLSQEKERWGLGRTRAEDLKRKQKELKERQHDVYKHVCSAAKRWFPDEVFGIIR